ncbi:MAG: tRNA (adenosine(37)-N6)-threonylcarbamoyltransferase complex dimerization subunit type 1 TsaB [Deltaproteobacteria bacterium]|nr:tRNA (adenosine(37)-N6)-threonylcarbamoyltransferase complex dimerization subunit type 1 TsaB [Deltaproteobacteria bacterium]
MLILGIEASTPVSSVALLGSEGLIAEYSLVLRRTHSERLLPAIETILRDTNLSGEDLTGVAISVGPGSFTGLRVAVSTAKGLVRAWEKPVIPVSSLEGLAYHFPAVKLPLYALLDARKGEVYAARFRNRDGVLYAETEERVIRPEDLCREVREETLFVGEGALRYRSFLEEVLVSKAVFVEGSLNHLSAASIAEIGYAAFREGRTLTPAELTPRYLRRSEAELQWNRKWLCRKKL